MKQTTYRTDRHNQANQRERTDDSNQYILSYTQICE